MNVQIGPRMIKTGLAVFITLWITQSIQTELVIIPIIAAVLALQPSIMRSWKYLKEVLVSNIMAVGFSVAALYLFGSTPFSIAIVVILSIAINLQLKLHKTMNITVLAIAAIMISSEQDVNFAYVLERIELLAIGIMSAFVINMLVSPPNHQKLMYGQIKKSSEQTNALLKLIPEKSYHLTDFKKQIKKVEETVSKAKEYHVIVHEEKNNRFIRERGTFLRDIIIYKQMLIVLEREVRLIKSLADNLTKLETYSEKQSELMKQTIQELIRYQETIQLMYQDKVVIDAEIDTESKEMVRLSVNDLIRELKASEDESWSTIFPIASGVVELYAETEKLERMVRRKRKKKEKRQWLKKGLEKILN